MKVFLPLFITILQFAWNAGQAQAKKDMAPSAPAIYDTATNLKKAHQSVTYNAVTVAGSRISYKAVAGTIVLKNAADTPTASIFYVAYFKEGDKDAARRPVTFLYNGGPGSSTIWLHMGAFGPQRVYLADTNRTQAPFRTVNNDYR